MISISYDGGELLKLSVPLREIPLYIFTLFETMGTQV